MFKLKKSRETRVIFFVLIVIMSYNRKNSFWEYKVISWLKFYFLGFFVDKYGKEAATRSFLNTVLSIILSFLLLCAGISAGFAASFGVHYDNADAFQSFLYSFFAEDGASFIGLDFKDGKLNAKINGAQCVNTIKSGEEAVGGYRLIVDTRDARTTFDDFKLLCKDENGNEISYEDYRKLSLSEKNKSTAEIIYSGEALDVALKHADYTAFLDKISDEADDEYNEKTASAYGELKNKKNLGEISEEEYFIEIYVLYAKAYYPEYSGVEIYGDAPTLRTYYMQPSLTADGGKYLILLDDLCICSFETNNNVKIDFGSYYDNIEDVIICAEGMDNEIMRSNVDNFIDACFMGSGGFNFLVHVMNMGGFLPVLLLFIVILSLLVVLLCKALHLEFVSKISEMIKITGGYLLYASIITFLAQIIFSFVSSRSSIFILSEITLAVVLLLRVAALLIAEIIRGKKQKVSESNDSNEAA